MMKYCKPELSFFIFTSYERSECFILRSETEQCFITKLLHLKRLHFYEARLSAYEAFCGIAAKYEAPQMRYEAKPFQASCFFTLKSRQKKMAEGVGFEPTEGCPSAVFKTAALNHSTILPRNMRYIIVCPINMIQFLKFSSRNCKKIEKFLNNTEIDVNLHCPVIQKLLLSAIFYWRRLI